MDLLTQVLASALHHQHIIMMVRMLRITCLKTWFVVVMLLMFEWRTLWIFSPRLSQDDDVEEEEKEKEDDNDEM